MPVGTGNISLQNVVDEIAGVQTSLQGCVNDADAGGFNGTYYTAPATSLAEFRGYDDTPDSIVVTPSSISTGNGSGSQLMTITSNVNWTITFTHSTASFTSITGSTGGSFNETRTWSWTANAGSTRFASFIVTKDGGGLSDATALTQTS